VHLTDTRQAFRLTLRNGVLSHTAVLPDTPADAVLRLPAAGLAAVATGATDPAALAAAGVRVDGDPTALGRLVGALEAPDPDFAIVTP
jgi:alkyl sulfatase BDS1-like metallo-beta-lactamase superfamily hydrolase